MKISVTSEFHQLFQSIHTTEERKWQFEIIGINSEYSTAADRIYINEVLTVDAARKKAEKQFLQENKGYRIKEIIYIGH